jgi:hypothetical protein
MGLEEAKGGHESQEQTSLPVKKVSQIGMPRELPFQDPKQVKNALPPHPPPVFLFGKGREGEAAGRCSAVDHIQRLDEEMRVSKLTCGLRIPTGEDRAADQGGGHQEAGRVCRKGVQHTLFATHTRTRTRTRTHRNTSEHAVFPATAKPRRIQRVVAKAQSPTRKTLGTSAYTRSPNIFSCAGTAKGTSEEAASRCRMGGGDEGILHRCGKWQCEQKHVHTATGTGILENTHTHTHTHRHSPVVDPDHDPLRRGHPKHTTGGH